MKKEGLFWKRILWVVRKSFEERPLYFGVFVFIVLLGMLLVVNVAFVGNAMWVASGTMVSQLQPLRLVVKHTKCDSDSMGLLFDCEDDLFLRRLQLNESLRVGAVFTYRNDHDGLTIHRLHGVFVDGRLLFKGDNNAHFDLLVNRSLVVHEHVGWIDASVSDGVVVSVDGRGVG